MKPGRERSLLTLLLLLAALAVALRLVSVLQRHWSTPLQGRAAAAVAGAGPSFVPPAGYYERNVLLDIRSAHPGAPVLFAVGGAVPTATVGTLHERPLLLDSRFPGVTVVRAREFVDGVPGPLASASYVVGVESGLPIVSIAADPSDLWGAERGIFDLANTWRGGQAWERPLHITYFSADRRSGFEIPAGMRLHRSERFDAPKQSLRLYFRRDYGAGRLEYELFEEHPFQDAQSYDRLLLQAGVRGERWTLLDEHLVSDVAAGLGHPVAQGRWVLLFVNGEPWGVYRLSERLDRFFLEDNLGIAPADVVRNGDTIEGDPGHWDGLLDWLAGHSLADEDNFAAVEAQVDLAAFTDYAILQAYFGFPPQRYVAARAQSAGGRWFWLYGDSGQAVPPDAGPGMWQPRSGTGDLPDLLEALLENPGYRAAFTRRAAGLLNTALAPDVVEGRVDRLAAQLRPEIAYETARWPSLTDWEGNVDALRAFARQRPGALREELAAAFDLRGTAGLTFSVGSGAGSIYVDGFELPGLPWNGTHFLDGELQAVAVPAAGYVFDGWDGWEGGAAVTLTVDGPRTLSARFVPASGDALQPDDVLINEYWINDDGTAYRSMGGRSIEGDWLELWVARPHTVDLRGWRITDNDTQTGSVEGSVILPWVDELAAVPRGTAILIVATESNANAASFPQDDLGSRDGQMVFYVGNGNLDVSPDPGFNVGPRDDNLVLLAPGPGPGFADDVGVDFVAEGTAVTPLSFGVLAEGVVFTHPFRRLGNDDGAIFNRPAGNDDGDVGWIVDPPAHLSGDGQGLGATNILTPGAPNEGQRGGLLRAAAPWLLPAGLLALLSAAYVRVRRAQRSRRMIGR